jgi:hypothetical protein
MTDLDGSFGCYRTGLGFIGAPFGIGAAPSFPIDCVEIGERQGQEGERRWLNLRRAAIEAFRMTNSESSSQNQRSKSSSIPLSFYSSMTGFLAIRRRTTDLFVVKGQGSVAVRVHDGRGWIVWFVSHGRRQFL